MQPTRMKILRYLEKFPSSSAREISRYLDMTAANIRYHLEFLVDSEKVQISGERPTGGAGRPILLYTLTSAVIGINLIPLLEAVIESIDNISCQLGSSSGRSSDRITPLPVWKFGPNSSRFVSN